MHISKPSDDLLDVNCVLLYIVRQMFETPYTAATHNNVLIAMATGGEKKTRYQMVVWIIKKGGSPLKRGKVL